MYNDKLNDTVNKNNNYHHTIMKPNDVKSSTYIELNKENNKEDPKSKIGYKVRISKYESIIAKGYIPNWSKEVFLI